MAYDNNTQHTSDRNQESLYSKRVKAGKRRTYFFDVRATRGNDYFITITESKKRFDDNGYDRHKMFLYKEDFNKFLAGLTDTINFVKTDLMPNFDFDAFNHDNDEEWNGQSSGHHHHNAEPAASEMHTQPSVEPIAVLPTEVITSVEDTTVVDEWKM